MKFEDSELANMKTSGPIVRLNAKLNVPMRVLFNQFLPQIRSMRSRTEAMIISGYSV